MSAGNISETSWNLPLQYDLEIVFPPLFFTQYSKNHSVFPLHRKWVELRGGGGCMCEQLSNVMNMMLNNQLCILELCHNQCCKEELFNKKAKWQVYMDFFNL